MRCSRSSRKSPAGTADCSSKNLPVKTLSMVWWKENRAIGSLLCRAVGIDDL